MARIIWDQTGKKTYETGTDRGVLYPMKGGTYSTGTGWDGITGVTLSPSGAESTALYADNIKYCNLISAEELGGTIEAYSYPTEFEECDGSKEVAPGVTIGQQNRTPFGFCYRTIIGNDTESNDHGYKLHIIYNATASPSERAYTSINDSPEAITFSWEFSTTATEVGGDYKPTSLVEIDSTETDATKLKALEDILYGTEENEPRLPTISEIITLMTSAAG